MISIGGESSFSYYNAWAKSGHFNISVMLLFIAFTQIAVLNIILGIFVDHAMKCMISEQEDRVKDHAMEEAYLKGQLVHMLRTVDDDGDGKISTEEWTTALANGAVVQYLDMMGFPPGDVAEFFRLLAC